MTMYMCLLVNLSLPVTFKNILPRFVTQGDFPTYTEYCKVQRIYFDYVCLGHVCLLHVNTTPVD